MLALAPKSEQTFWSWLLSSVYFPPALWGVIYSLRTRVEAGENGVRWRDYRGVWRAAKWDEILDFYTLSAKGSNYGVETAAGQFEFVSQGEGKLLAEWIPQRALNAQVREWDIQGERPCDPWPRRFEFWRPDLAVAARYALLVLLAAVGLTIYIVWFRLPPRGEISSGAYFLAYAAPPLIIPVVPFLFWLFLWLQERQARPFRGQNVEVSPTGLVFNCATRVEASWNQIEAWQLKQHGKIRFLELQTASESAQIPAFTAGFYPLCRIIERFSGLPLIKAQEEASMTVNPIQNAPDDTPIFSFNTLGLHSTSWYFLSIGMAIILMPFLLRVADPQTPRHDEVWGFGVGAVMIALSIGWMWFLRVARLRLTPDDLEWHAPFFQRNVAWRDIDTFGTTTSQLDWVEVAGKKIKLSLFNLSASQRSQLRAEIEKRAFNAQGNWQ